MAQAWHLMRRPSGTPVMDDFALKPVDLPALEDGMVRVANRWLSVDPYMRGRMNDVKSYVPPFALDAPMTGGAVGEVVESRDPSLQPGDMVLHMAGWRDEVVEPASNFNKLPTMPGVEPQSFLGNLGLTGGTAYFGLLAAASAKAGDIVFVSAADRQGQGHDRNRLGRWCGEM
jgi:NADPH-dependent curcumin reductase CurA